MNAPRRRLLSRFFLTAASLGFFASTGWLSSGCNTLRYAETFVPDGVVQRVVVRSESGSVSLVRGKELRVDREVYAIERALSLSHEVRDGVLYLNARCTSVLPCRVNTIVSLPDALPVEVELGTGSLDATAIGPLTARVGSGDVSVDVTGTLRIQLGSGNVRATVVDGRDVRVAVGDGNVALGVPAGKYMLDITAARVRTEGVDPVSSEAETKEAVSELGRVTVVAPSGAVSLIGQESLASR
jgi:hypothetical protein